MIKKTRPLTKLELQQLRITQAVFEKKLKQSFLLQPVFHYFIIFSLILLGCLLLSTLNVSGAILLVMVIISILISFINTIRKFKKRQQFNVKNIEKVIKNGIVEVIEYKCTRAIHFALDEYFIENWFLLELENKKILCLYTNYWTDKKSLPNTYFELYANDEIQRIFLAKCNSLGEIFKPINFSVEFYGAMTKTFPEYFKDEEVIDTSFEEILNEIERQVKA